MWSPPYLPSAIPYAPHAVPCGEPANIPLHLPPNPDSMAIPNIATTICTILACIDICVVMITMYITSTEVNEGHFSHMKKLRKRSEDDVCVSWHNPSDRHQPEDDALEHPHVKQIFDLLAWHIGLVDAKWYVKPRSTYWFEEYLFNIYTPDMFYDILRMRRRTFDRLVRGLQPFIQGQHIHWTQPIKVEKKVVVTLFKLMHGVSIPLSRTRPYWTNSLYMEYCGKYARP